jgi:hypothetical protein
MKLYRIDIRVAASAIIKAESPSAATRKLSEFCKQPLIVEGALICQQINDPAVPGPDVLPEISLDPHFVMYDRWPGAAIEEWVEPVTPEGSDVPV